MEERKKFNPKDYDFDNNYLVKVELLGKELGEELGEEWRSSVIKGT